MVLLCLCCGLVMISTDNPGCQCLAGEVLPLHRGDQAGEPWLCLPLPSRAASQAPTNSHSSQPTWGSSSDTGVTVGGDCGPTAYPQPHGRCLRWDICAHLCVPGLQEAAQTPSLLPSPQNHVSGQARWPPGTQHHFHLAKPRWVHMDGATTPHIFHPHHTSPHALQLPRAARCAVGQGAASAEPWDGRPKALTQLGWEPAPCPALTPGQGSSRGHALSGLGWGHRPERTYLRAFRYWCGILHPREQKASGQLSRHY